MIFCIATFFIPLFGNVMNTLYFKTTPTSTTIVSQSAESDYVWLDYSRDEVTENPKKWVTEMAQVCGIVLDEYHLTDILNPQHPSFFDLTNEYEVLIFRKLFAASAKNNTTDSMEINTTPVAFILTDKVLVTVRESTSQTFAQIRQRFNQTSEHSAKSRLPHSPLDLCLRILNVVIDRYLDLRAPLTERIELWQTELLQGSHRFNHWPQLLKENLNLQQLENLCEEQQDALQELRDNYLDQQDNSETQLNASRRDLMLVRINDLVEHVTRVQRHASRMELALKSAVDLHFSATANDTNEAMRFLAIITAVFAPLTLLTGIYGMNFEFMPGLDRRNGFWWLLLGMLGTTTILLYYFRRRRLVGRGKISVTQLLASKADK